ncbi:MAG: hypothetical protein ACJAU6_003281 [Alphaproteobacteria bacterium]|jgi:hypothetical protein
MSDLERNKEIGVTRSRAPIRHLKRQYGLAANTGYGAEQKPVILWTGGNGE